jgi:hypothetical protein
MSKSRLVGSSVILAGLSLGQSQVAHAGWSGAMNGSGFGRATANVTSVTGAGSTATITTLGPSSAVQTTGGYLAGAPLPSGASPGTISLIKGSAGYIWQANTFATGGDRTDNLAIESLNPPVIPQLSAFLQLVTSVIYDSEGHPIFLDVDGIATGGTALLVRGFDLPNGLPEGEPDLTPLFEQLILGEGAFDPVTLGNAFHVEIPFPDVNPDELYFFVDGFAASAAVPDSGDLGFAFALTVGAMAVMRRRLGHSATQA